MKICFLSSAHPPFDKRVFDKEAISLVQAGFEVIHLAPAEQQMDKKHRGVRVVTYKRLPGVFKRFLRLPALYWRALKLQAHCYHCNEMDSWIVGVCLKLTHKTKVVFDVHEHYPSIMCERFFPKYLHPFVAFAVRFLFKVLAPFTDYIVFAKKSVIKDFEHCKNKHILVRNFTPLSELSFGLENKANSCITMVHLGLISRVRGWEPLLKAMPQTDENLQLCIIGTFNDGSLPDFLELAAKLGVKQRIKIEEWMPFEQAFELLKKAHIGLVLFQPGVQNHIFAFPHKMFDYMLARMAIVIPEFATEVAQIVQKENCGLLVDSASSDSIAKALNTLTKQAQKRQQMGQKGHEAVIARYNWEKECQKLIDIYHNFQ